MADVQAAHATRGGSRSYNCDAAVVHRVPGTQVTAGAIVDGIGNSAEIAHLATVAAEVVARVGARHTATIGILAAAELIATPAGAEITPDGVAVVAVAEPGHETSIAWTGDCRAYGFDGTALRQRSTDQTMGQWLRVSGGPAAEIAHGHDHWILSTLGRCSIATVHATHITDPLVLLTSDGVHDSLPHPTLEALVAQHHDDLPTLVQEIVNAVEVDADGDRDDATAVALLIPRDT